MSKRSWWDEGNGPAEHKDPGSKLNKPRKPKAKKNTRRWCKGVVGREHKPEIKIPKNQYTWLKNRPEICHEGRGWTYYKDKDKPNKWWCYHKSICKVCEKVLEEHVRCPDNTTKMPQMWLKEDEGR